ncbi:hypothetical protein PTKIN_Ptkin17bG0101900 [Pterospermum kingtungense]
MSFQLLLVFFFALFCRFYQLEGAGFKSNVVRCIGTERKALPKCSNVVVLDLGLNYDWPSERGDSPRPYMFCQLGGTLNPCLLNLSHLNYLDVSSINFLGIPIPNFIGSLKNLKHLDLQSANFSGMVPPHLGNLSNLVYLDLNMGFSNSEELWVSDLETCKP